jgi:uncharacterized protein YndB with AHSA1/START domain
VRDMLEELAAAHRAVGRRAGRDGEVVAVRLRRAYDAELTDVWDAVTDPARLARWFSPVSGELRVGGTFQVEGNAAGEVLQCAPPEHFRVTWGGPTSLVDVRLTADGESTVVELEHSVPIEIAQSGAGALFVGPGWDAGVLALGLSCAARTSATRSPGRTRWRCSATPPGSSTPGSRSPWPVGRRPPTRSP